MVTRAYPYRLVKRSEFDELITLLHTGIENSRGRYGAYLLRDGVAGVLHPRRGARLTAIGNGGAIPDNASYAVVLQPEGVQIATLDEHYAVVLGHYHLDRSKKGGGNADGFFSLVLEKTDAGWKIIVDHTT